MIISCMVVLQWFFNRFYKAEWFSSRCITVFFVFFPSATPLSVRCSSDPALAPPLDVFSMDPEDTISRPQSTVSEHTPHTDAWQECLSSFLFSVVTANEVQICIVLLEEAVLLSSWSFDVFILSLFAGFNTKQSTFTVILYLCWRLTF